MTTKKAAQTTHFILTPVTIYTLRVTVRFWSVVSTSTCI